MSPVALTIAELTVANVESATAPVAEAICVPVIVAAALVTQLILGPVMVLETFPLPLATAHNAVAALLLLSTVALLRFLWPPERSL